MDRNDLRPEAWMQHLQEELGDALQYAERIKNLGKLLDDARSIMLTLLHERDWECAAEWVARHDAQFFSEERAKTHER
jgi:lauroyl/myristoyl acyltransferase